MLVAIISDIHNNLVNLKKVLAYCKEKNIETIICCGDLASLETLDFLNDNFSGKIYYAFGNMDNDQLRGHLMSNWTSNVQKYKSTLLYKNFGELKISTSPAQGEASEGRRGGRKVAFVHFPNIAKELCESGKYSFVFYGHTHKPWEEIINNCKMLNPGNVAGEIYPPTFAVWNTKNDSFKLIRVHSLK